MNFKAWLILFVVTILVVALFIGVSTKKQNDSENINKLKYMKIESEVFVNNGKIPVEYTCDEGGTQPPLQVLDVPKDAKSLALIVDDPDAPNGDFVHWLIWNIDPKISVIKNGNIPGATEGYTSLNKPGWVAPCPPSGIHHYNFKLYALDIVLSIPKSSAKIDLVRVMDGHIINNATLVGLYAR